MAGIHHAERGEDIVRLADVEHVQLGLFPQAGNIFVGEAHLLGLQQALHIVHMEL